MTLEAMRARIIDEALAAVRERGEQQAITDRLHRICEDAASAQRVARLRRALR